MSLTGESPPSSIPFAHWRLGACQALGKRPHERGGGQALINGRILSFRVFRCDWLADSSPESAPFTAWPAPFRPVSRFREVAVGGVRFLRNLPQTTMIFNGENWGLAEFDPPEVNPV